MIVTFLKEVVFWFGEIAALICLETFKRVLFRSSGIGKRSFINQTTALV